MIYYIRNMELWDISQVSQIEREAFPPPWPGTNFKHELKSNSLTHYLIAYKEAPEQKEPTSEGETARDPGHTRSKLGTLIYGLRCLFGGSEKQAVTNQFILGFAGLWFMADEAHLANIAVRDAYRRQGIGERLLISAIELAIANNESIFTLEVRVSNTLAQALYRKYGLLEVGKRRGYYMDNKEDAVIMTVEDITSASYVKMFQNLKQAHASKWGLGSVSLSRESKLLPHDQARQGQ